MTKTRTLYNEYRPKEFSDVVGQEIPVKTMVNALKSGKVASAYLFSGPRGIGKTTCARIFAKALLCLEDEREGADGCGACASCREFDEGMASDFMEIDAATNRGIDNIRELKERVYMAPRISSRKVILIDEVHHLTSDAATALLKILEEPPAGVVFLLATTDPQKIPATIRSRCQWMRFRPLDTRQIEERLSYVLGREGREAESGVVQLVARRADGGMRDALSDLDLLITYTGGGKITLDATETCFGTVSRDLVSELAGYIMEGDIARCVGFTVRHRSDDVAAKDMLVALLDLIELGLIIQHCGMDSAVALEGAAPATADLAQKLAKKLGDERTVMAADTIARNLWKFDNSALDDAHVFNEVMLFIVKPELDPRHLALDDQDRAEIKKTREKVEAVSKAVNALVEVQKKVLSKK